MIELIARYSLAPAFLFLRTTEVASQWRRKRRPSNGDKSEICERQFSPKMPGKI